MHFIRTSKTTSHESDCKRQVSVSFWTFYLTIFDTWGIEQVYLFFIRYIYLIRILSLHSQPKVGFREYFEYFLMRLKSLTNKSLGILILHINNSKKLLKNLWKKSGNVTFFAKIYFSIRPNTYKFFQVSFLFSKIPFIEKSVSRICGWGLKF